MIYVEVLAEELPVADFMVDETVPLKNVIDEVTDILGLHGILFGVRELTENRILAPELALGDQGVSDGCRLRMEVDHGLPQ